MRKALAESETDFAELYGALKGNTCVMFTQNANAPARIIKEFAKANKELGFYQEQRRARGRSGCPLAVAC